MFRKTILSTAIALLLATGAIADEAAQNPLMEKAFYSDSTTASDIQAVFDQGFGTGDRDRYGRNPLHIAIRAKAPIEVIKLLIENGAAVNQPAGKRGALVTMAAARAGDLDLLKLLDTAGADWMAVSDIKLTPLHRLSSNANATTDMVDFLLSKGVDPAAQSQMGDTAAMRMAYSKAKDPGVLYDYLIANGSPDLGFNADGEDSFMKAISYAGKGAWLERLYEASEEPQAANNAGLSGVLLASRWGIDADRLEFLKTHGFDLFIETAKGENALILDTEEGDADSVALLLAEGFDVNSKSDTGKTPLLNAFRHKNDYQPDVVRALIAAGADLTHADDKGVTALMKLLEAPVGDAQSEEGVQKLALFDLMLTGGADLTVQDAGGATTLIYAVRGGQPVERLKTILAAGVDVNAQDRDGMTALMYAAAGAPDPAVLELLLDAGADSAVTDIFDDGAAQYAADNPALTGAAVLGRL